MSDYIDYLGQLELSDMEAKLYLKLLEVGPINVSNLAKALGIRRTSTYLYLEPLFAKGLVTKIVNKSKKQVAPTDPENLEMLIDQRIAHTKALKEQFPDVLKKIKGAFPGFKEITNVEIKYYKGLQNARKIYLEALRANELRAYIRIAKTEPLFPDNALVFSKAFRENKKLKIWEIIYDPESSVSPSKESRSQMGRYFYKYMPKSKKLSSEDILMYDGKVAVINFRSGKTSIVLHSHDLYNNFKEIFELLWSILPETQLHDS
jgi:sugar-specific transcriptional regulator TrmB